MRMVFGDCVLDTSCFELHRRARRVKLEPKVFDVLQYLVERRDRVVTKDELLDALWPGEAVSDSVLPRCIAAMRRAVGDTRTRQKVIATIHGRGYRFVAPIDEPDSEQHEAVSDTSPVVPVQASERREDAPEEAVASHGDFVGRAESLARMRSALAAAREGRGGLCLVVGEPGIGKTRITEELARRAEADGCEVLIGRCYEGEGAPAYWPWIQILREAANRTPDDEALIEQIGAGASDLATLVPEIRMRVGDVAQVIGPEGEQARFRLFDAASRFLLSRSRTVPLVLIVDDLHWADASSLGLLQFLVGMISNHAVLVVGTYRDVDVRRGHPLARVLGSLSRVGSVDRIVLGGLAEDEIGRLILHLAGEEAGAGLSTTLREMTEGNPFFVREIVRLLSDRGEVSAAGVDSVHSLSLPQGVKDAIGRRLDALSDECNEMLRSAAVVGRDFEAILLESMVDVAEIEQNESLLELLAEALDAGVIEERGQGRYAFSHALTRQTLYEELRAPQRVSLHRRAGEALEGRSAPGGDPDEWLAELAHHFFEAVPGGDVDKAVDYALRAAAESHAKCAYDEAVLHNERALEALLSSTPVDEIRRIEILLALGESLFTAGHRDRALPVLHEVADRARRNARPDYMAKAVIAIRGFGEFGTTPSPEVLALLHEANAALPVEEYTLRSRLVSRMGGVAANSMADRRRLAEEALELARKSGDPVAQRDALSAEWWASLGPDRVAHRFEIAEALRSLGEETGDVRTRLLSLEVELGANLIRGNFKETERNIDDYEALALELRQPVFIFMGMVCRTSWLINRGRYREAQSNVDAALEMGRDVVPFAEIMCNGQKFWSRSMSGADTAANESARSLAEMFQFTFAGDDVRKLFLALIDFSVDQDIERVVSELTVLDYRSIERDEHWLLAISIAAEIVALSKDTELMRSLLDILTPFRDLFAIHDLMRSGRGSVASTMAELHHGLGEIDAAIADFEIAIDLENRADMQRAVIRSELGLARALCDRGADGDVQRAGLLAAKARHSMGDFGVDANGREQAVLDLLGK